jgi:hypothetical protein
VTLTGPGARSDPQPDASGGHSNGESASVEPYVRRELLRLTNVYATTWRSEPGPEGDRGRPAGEVLRLGRLAGFYQAAEQQLPRVLGRIDYPPTAVECDRWTGASALAAVRAWLLALASGQVLAALTLDVACTPVEAIPLLEDCYYASVRMAGRPLTEQLAAQAGALLGEAKGSGLLPERHQLVFASVRDNDPASLLTADDLQQVIYRSALPYRAEHSLIRYPAELNRRPTTIAAVGPYVSVLAGQQDSIENAVWLSAVQAVGAAARLREIRGQAYQCVRAFRAGPDPAADRDTHERRRLLEGLADTTSDLELELSFAVEATSDLGMLVPSLRVESYHLLLYDAMRLSERARTTARMLTRLGTVVDAERTAIESVERRTDDRQRLRTAAAVTVVTTLAGTLALLFAFFGGGGPADRGRSMFDLHHYVGIYAVLAAIVLAGAAVFLTLWFLDRRASAPSRARSPAFPGGAG